MLAAGCGKRVVVGPDRIICGRGELWYEVKFHKPFTGVWISYFENGQKMMDTEFRAGKLNGPSTWWYKNGQKEHEGEWRDGKKNGTWTFWYENGQKRTVIEWRDDTDVSRIDWDTNGNQFKPNPSDRYPFPLRNKGP